MAGGKSGLVVSSRPKRYKTLPQQSRVREANEYCGIKKGISREELVDKMKNCIPEFYRKKRGGE
jgi:hypothetical protein